MPNELRKVVAAAIEPLVDTRPIIDAPQSVIRRLQAERFANAAIEAMQTHESERAAIVAWLRMSADHHEDIGRTRGVRTYHFAKAQTLRDAARDIERGDHIKEQSNDQR